MIILLGSDALSEFRRQKLQGQLEEVSAKARLTKTQYCYFIHSAQTCSESAIAKIKDILQAPTECQLIPQPDSAWIVVPRLGTISPWASKALDILQLSGMQQVNRIERGIVYYLANVSDEKAVKALLHDKMTESILQDFVSAEKIFQSWPASSYQTIPILAEGACALERANQLLGLALSGDEIGYLVNEFQQMARDPTDVELMMFAQANSEHCRHKIFNASWTIDGKSMPRSLFSMIRHTHELHPQQVLSAYEDNASVIHGSAAKRLMISDDKKQYYYAHEHIHYLMKVETHNHPTAISPYAGAATGVGGEIRDEGATGCGARPKAGLSGFAVSHLKIADYTHAWEIDYGKPEHMASALQIMIDGPLGAAAFNNEFGRPNLTGFFRTFELKVGDDIRGYHKPIMIAGGLGNVRPTDVHKRDIPAGSKIIVLGGPAMLIGLGGGAASSLASGTSSNELDFASVQRSNPEMQRRAQEVIDQCFMLGDKNPILSIHDVGAGGLSNAIPEILHGSDRGGDIYLRAILNAEPSMSPLAIWCNEAQERYVLAVHEASVPMILAIAERERCPISVVGEATESTHLTLQDAEFANKPIDLPMSVLFGKSPSIEFSVQRNQKILKPLQRPNWSLSETLQHILQVPTVADKGFLITIGDRSVGGMTARDQFVGPWQVPVADVAVTALGFESYQGEAMAMGERSPLALISPEASARMAIAEAITNIAACSIGALSQVKLSANWMAAARVPGEEVALYDAVYAAAMEFCPQLGLVIPVGKDSLSMRTVWQQEARQQSVTSPLSLIISAFASVQDIRQTLTPVLQVNQETALLFLDLAARQQRLGGSVWALITQQLGDACPDVSDPNRLKRFFAAIQELIQAQQLLAYHDRSDGGLLITLCEMAFAAHAGMKLDISALGQDAVASLFNEELGVVFQIRRQDKPTVMEILEKHQLAEYCYDIGVPTRERTLSISLHNQLILHECCINLHTLWAKTSYHIRKLRDNPVSAAQEFTQFAEQNNPGLHVHLTFPLPNSLPPVIAQKPRVAILREQGVNGQMEMAAAFDRAGFLSVDVHMSDVLAGRVTLDHFVGLAACGGFSYGDVLGAGRGWAQSILHNPNARNEFAKFFARSNTFTLGVCNGCQMLSQLKFLIPGAEHWPVFIRNRSEQYEARLVMSEVAESPSIFFKSMTGSRIPIVVSHGEGKAYWEENSAYQQIEKDRLVALRFVDNAGQITERYPQNPNGSPKGITALTTLDGRATIMMPHPERVFRSVQFSWHPEEWDENSPWLQIFLNARAWVEANH